MTKTILIARVIKDKQAKKFFLNTTEEKRLHLLKNIVSTLILEQRIKTTDAKAKFVQFYADRLVDLAKDGSESAYNQAKRLVQSPDVVLPILFGPMAARYAQTTDSFTTVLLNGQRDYKKATQGKMQYPDAAKMSILEFKHTEKSVTYLLARRSLPTFEELFKESSKVQNEKKGLLSWEAQKLLDRKVVSLENQIQRYKTTIETFESCWSLEETFLESNMKKYQLMFNASEITSEQLLNLGYKCESGIVSVKQPIGFNSYPSNDKQMNVKKIKLPTIDSKDSKVASPSTKEDIINKQILPKRSKLSFMSDIFKFRK